MKRRLGHFWGGLWLAVLAWQCAGPTASPAGGSLPQPASNFFQKTPAEVADFAQKLTDVRLLDSLYQPVIEHHLEYDRTNLGAENLVFYEKMRGSASEVQPALGYFRGNVLQFSGKLDSAKTLFDAALAAAEKLGQSRWHAKALHGVATNLYFRGEYGQSTETFLRAMLEYAALGDSAHLNMAKLDHCGNLYRMRDFDQMNTLARTTLPWFSRTRDSFYLATLYNIFGLRYEGAQQFDSAITWHKRALDLRRRIGDLRGAGESSNNIAVLLVEQKKYPEAAELYGDAIELMRKTGDLRNLNILKINRGRCLSAMGRYSEALQIFETALHELRANGQRDAVMIALERMSYANSSLGNYKEALSLYVSSRALKDSLINERKQQDIRELNVRFETALKEQQIAKLEAEKRSTRLWFWLMGMALLLLASLFGFNFFRLRQKQKLLAGEQKLREARELIQAKTLQITQKDLEFNRRQLEETATNLTEKSRLVDVLRDNLDTLRQSLGEQYHQRDVQQSLAALYSMKILTEDDWNLFRIQFEQVHPGLINQYRKRFSDISDAELRLILLIKIGSRSREIANVLGISPESVNKTRYRLRKRLGLSENDRLEEFLEQMR